MANARCDVSGVVWKVEVAIGQAVAEGDVLLILESMKMEIPVLAERSGTVAELRVAVGDQVREGAIIAVVN